MAAVLKKPHKATFTFTSVVDERNVSMKWAEWFWHGKIDVPVDKPVSVPVCPTHITNRLAWDQSKASRAQSVLQNLHTVHTHKQLHLKGLFYSLSTNVLETTLGAFQKYLPQHYNWLKRCVINSKMNYRQVSFYARVMFLKRSHQWRTQEFFSGGGSTNSVEEREQRERGSGGGSPLVRGSGGSCNLVLYKKLQLIW